MTDELPRPLWQLFDKFLKSLQSQASGGRNPNAAIGCDHPRRVQNASKTGAVTPQCSELKLPLPAPQFREQQGLERVSYRPDSAIPSRRNHPFQDHLEDVRVLVRIQMGNSDAGRMQLLDLRRNFVLDLFLVQPPCDCLARKADQAFPKTLHRARICDNQT